MVNHSYPPLSDSEEINWELHSTYGYDQADSQLTIYAHDLLLFFLGS